MLRSLKIITLLLVSLMVASVSAVSTPDVQCPTEIARLGRKHAKELANETMRKISSNTGTNPDFKLTSCDYDGLNGRIVFDVELTWSAKSCVMCFDRQQAKVWGEIRIDEDNMNRASFEMEGMSSFAKECAASRKYDILEAIIITTVNSGSGR
jgi:hypothetical protein